MSDVRMVEGKEGDSLNNELDFRWSHGSRQGGESCNKGLRFQMVAWWKAKQGKILIRVTFQRSHGGRQGGEKKDSDFR